MNLLNAEDNGRRRCIMVTNNEVSDKEEQELKEKGLKKVIRSGGFRNCNTCYLA